VAAVVIRAHRRRPLTGGEALVGEVGVVRQVQGNQGKILVHGELWNVRFEQPAAVGTPVKVLEVRNLVLKVTPVAE
jgi:membrane-bound serine protease (ClpP class)